MSTITRFEEIEAWKTARELTGYIYQLTSEGPFAKDFGLRDQIRRASVSVMSNIAEGFESQTQSQFIHYLCVSKASAGEVRSQLYIALDVNYLDQAQFNQAYNLADKVIRQISRFITYLELHPESRRIKEEEPAYLIESGEN